MPWSARNESLNSNDLNSTQIPPVMYLSGMPEKRSLMWRENFPACFSLAATAFSNVFSLIRVDRDFVTVGTPVLLILHNEVESLNHAVRAMEQFVVTVPGIEREHNEVTFD